MECPVCDSNNWNNGKKLTTCEECGYVRASDRYYQFQEGYASIYSNTYYQGGDYTDYEQEESALKRNFRDRLRRIGKYAQSGKLLEVGCAYGFFLDLAKEKFQVSGVEMNPEVAAIVSKRLAIKVVTGDFCTYSEEDLGKFDIIVSLDTIEHVLKPKEFLDLCYKLLKPKGYLALETGDVGSYLGRRRGEKWRLVYPPEHLNYFSKKTLNAILQKTGFTVLENTNKILFWRSTAQVLYRLVPGVYDMLPQWGRSLLGRVIFPTSTFDLMFVVSQKP